MADELRSIPGIGLVQSVRVARVPIRGVPIMFVAVDVGTLRSRAQVPVIAGDRATMYDLTAAGKGLLASENFAILHGFKVGDIVEMPTPTGMLRLPVLGVVTDYSDQQGSILMDRIVYARYWKDDTANLFRVFLATGASEGDVKRRILEKFGSDRRLFVLTNRDVRDYILKLTNQWFGITYVQIAVAVLVAVLGIINTLTVSITDRRRELGVLQAVGGLRNQVRRTIWMEALSIGVIGVVLGLALGAVQLYYSLRISAEDIAGLRLNYLYPYGMALALLPLMLAAAFVAAVGPGETAVRGSLVEALEYE